MNNHRYKLIWSMAAAIALSFGFIATAQAEQDPDELFEQLSADEEEQVLKLLDQAEEAYDEGEFQTALSRFNQAYQTFPHPDLLYRIALCYERLGNDELAIQHYRHFLEEMPEARERGRIERTIANLEEELGDDKSSVRFETFPIGAKVYVDDREQAPVAETPATVTLPPGNYVIYLVREGYETEEQRVQLDVGEELRYQVRMSEVETSEEPSSSVSWWQPAVSVLLIGGGGFGLYRAAGHHSLHGDYSTQLQEDQLSEERRGELEDLRDEQASQRLVMGIAGGVSMAAGAAFTAWWLLRDDDSPQDAQVAIQPLSDGVSIGIYGRF